MDDMLQLAAEQVLAPVVEDAIEALLSPRTLTALRRRFPRGSGMFLLTDTGQLYFDPGRGMAPIAVTTLEPDKARSVPRVPHDVDLVA